MVGLHFSAAFDRVNHEVLIFKMQLFGVVDPSLAVFLNFCLGEFRKLLLVFAGTVFLRGSVLGRFLFIIHA